jgi:hypothetical protein
MRPTRHRLGHPARHISLMAGIAFAAIVSVDVGSAFAQRYVVVNGYRLSAATIARLDYLACVTIPNGRYCKG